MSTNTMRIALIGTTLFVLTGAIATAKQLNGEEISSFLVGNTVEYTNPRTSNNGAPGTVHAWVYYESAEKRVVKGDFRFVTGRGEEKVRPFEYASKWRISNKGQYCSTSRKGDETCKNFSIEGDTVTLTSTLGTQTGKYHKGNPKGL